MNFKKSKITDDIHILCNENFKRKIYKSAKNNGYFFTRQKFSPTVVYFELKIIIGNFGDAIQRESLEVFCEINAALIYFTVVYFELKIYKLFPYTEDEYHPLFWTFLKFIRYSDFVKLSDLCYLGNPSSM